MSDSLAAHIETIERAYEYLLAYAAQGRQDDAGSEVRPMLQSMHDSLRSIGPLARIALPDAAASGRSSAWFDALQRDADVAAGAVALVSSRPRISSLLVDNLNASVHLRALLTDVFLLDQALQNPDPTRSP